MKSLIRQLVCCFYVIDFIVVCNAWTPAKAEKQVFYFSVAADQKQRHFLRKATYYAQLPIDSILFTLSFICFLFGVKCIYLCSRYIDKLFRSVKTVTDLKNITK